MTTKDRYRELAAMSRRMGLQAWGRELAAQLDRIAAEYERRAIEESDEPSGTE